MQTRKLLTVIMDGVGVRESEFGNAVLMAKTPNLNWLKEVASYTTIRAHGTAVGLPDDTDIGNSEVGHNALGSGQLFDQGAKLVNKSIKSGDMYLHQGWQDVISFTKNFNGTLHFLGLLSDGNVHSHEEHLYSMLKQAVKDGIKKIRIHVLFDGRDVEAISAEKYIANLQSAMTDLSQTGVDIKVASGGGRMVITMDRYEADWNMVKIGWNTHVLGKGPQYDSIQNALADFRKGTYTSDQDLPAFVIAENGVPVGTVEDGDGVIFYNFRGDRSIEISLAFEEQNFTKFDRERFPNICYAGMMEYDGDLHIPKRYLVEPPAITHTMGEYLAHQGINQFACSETQKFGHVTFFWNGNRSGYFDQNRETYLEVPSDVVPFNYTPWMKAYEITKATIKEMEKDHFQFGRINFPNGDMVGHTGDFYASIIGVETVDLMIGHLIKAAQRTNTILLITADHGNADQMFEGKAEDFPDWQSPTGKKPKGKTSHTVSQVPVYIFDPSRSTGLKLMECGKGTLSHIANTALNLMGLKSNSRFFDSLIMK